MTDDCIACWPCGSVGYIGNARGLQSFLPRWVCTALACRIIVTLPQSYKPGQSCNPDQEQTNQRAFVASHLLLKNLLSNLHDYTTAWPSRCPTGEMADSCIHPARDAHGVGETASGRRLHSQGFPILDMEFHLANACTEIQRGREKLQNSLPSDFSGNMNLHNSRFQWAALTRRHT